MAISQASGNVHLIDGSNVRRGAEVLELHLWNEHLPSLPSFGGGLGRASALRRQIGVSLCQLADHIGSEPSLDGVEALRARTAFVARNRMRKLLRIARAYGFDTATSSAAGPFRKRLHDFGENFFVWALAWTFNPAARGRRLLRPRCELWVSREAFMARYGQSLAESRRDIGTILPLTPAL
jgi:hypothetical protein